MNSRYRWNWLALCALIALGATSKTWGKSEINTEWNHTTMSIENPNDSVLIVAFGNSITAVRKTVDQVFAQRLPGLLAREGVNASVINSGIGGSHTGRRADHDLFKIRHGMDRFQSDVLDHQPDLVIIGFGTNDSYIDSKTPKGKSRIPLDAYRSNLEHFITKLRANGSKVVLIAPNILGARYGKFQNKRLLKYVKVVRKLSRKYDTGLVDNYKQFQKYAKDQNISYEALMLDGCHPNDTGHELIADHLTTEIIKQLKSD